MTGGCRIGFRRCVEPPSGTFATLTTSQFRRCRWPPNDAWIASGAWRPGGLAPHIFSCALVRVVRPPVRSGRSGRAIVTPDRRRASRDVVSAASPSRRYAPVPPIPELLLLAAQAVSRPGASGRRSRARQDRRSRDGAMGIRSARHALAHPGPSPAAAGSTTARRWKRLSISRRRRPLNRREKVPGLGHPPASLRKSGTTLPDRRGF